MDVDELRPGLWRWTLPHPDWRPEEAEDGGWEQIVASYSLETADGLVLADPLAPEPDSPEHERFWSALDRDVERAGPPAVLITVFWHARSAGPILERYEGASVWVHERAGAAARERVAYTDAFQIGDPLPGGFEALDARRFGEVLLWSPEHRALVAGDVLLGTPDGGVRMCPPSWLPEDIEPAEFRRSLQPLLELPIELVLLTHGEPVLAGGREAVARALA